MNDNFRLDSNRTIKGIIAMVIVSIITAIVGIGLLFGGIFLVIKAVQEIQERGLKDIVEEIWEGSNE